jgi:hypothetical protein
MMRKRSKAILVRVTDAEHAALTRLAHESGDSLSSYLRRLALFVRAAVPLGGDQGRAAVPLRPLPRAPASTAKRAAKRQPRGARGTV